MFEKPEEIRLPILSTNKTSGLANILQLTDVTSNEVFAIRDSTSKTEIIQIVSPPLKESEKE